MSYAIRAGENLSHALKRVSRAELRKARKALDDTAPGNAAEDAHALRLATKKVRAIARLVEPVVGRRARQANRQLGACADVMAAVRDADAAVRTFEKLRAGLPARMRSAIGAVRDALADRLQHEAEKMDPAGEGKRTLRKLRRALHRQQDRVTRWMPGGKNGHDHGGRNAPSISGWKHVGPGLEAGYRRARKTMQRAYRDPNGDTFHAWRRAVKAHRYQLRLLSPWAPDELGARTVELARLAELLGDEHDLTMLRRSLRANRFWFGDESDSYYEVIRRIDQQRREKRLQALPRGEQLFAERPRDLVQRMRQHLRAFRGTPAAAPNAAKVA
jgi:CHAD domain-containing protein